MQNMWTISIYDLENILDDCKSNLRSALIKYDKALKIVEYLPSELIKGIDTSRKSISIYITCFTKDYDKVKELLRAFINDDVIANSLGSEYEI